jgi:death-on-curing protein
VLAIHEWLLSAHGGPPGILDEGALEAALASPRNLVAYGKPDLFDLAAQYASALTRNHPFQDGNKRVALTVAGVFLEMNGRRLNAPEAEAVTATIALSTRDLDESGFAAWLRKNSSILRSAGKAQRQPRASKSQKSRTLKRSKRPSR